MFLEEQFIFYKLLAGDIPPFSIFPTLKVQRISTVKKTPNHKTLNKQTKNQSPPPPQLQTNKKSYHTNSQNKPQRCLVMWIPLDPCGYTISTTEKTNRTKRHLLRESREVSYVMWEILFADKILINSPLMLYRKRTSQYWSKMLKLQNAHFCLMRRMRSALHCNFYQPFIIGIKIYFTFHSIYK